MHAQAILDLAERAARGSRYRYLTTVGEAAVKTWFDSAPRMWITQREGGHKVSWLYAADLLTAQANHVTLVHELGATPPPPPP